eukprot:GHVQ01024969.1.p1 GENE.GHVQ01024969.1~~GHVQ01024969.1.p1  ORF type:complete len:831 (+),score=134.71 GHVQ01024969.1:2188-4680(+)
MFSTGGWWPVFGYAEEAQEEATATPEPLSPASESTPAVTQAPQTSQEQQCSGFWSYFANSDEVPTAQDVSPGAETDLAALGATPISTVQSEREEEELATGGVLSYFGYGPSEEELKSREELKEKLQQESVAKASEARKTEKENKRRLKQKKIKEREERNTVQQEEYRAECIRQEKENEEIEKKTCEEQQQSEKERRYRKEAKQLQRTYQLEIQREREHQTKKELRDREAGTELLTKHQEQLQRAREARNLKNEEKNTETTAKPQQVQALELQQTQDRQAELLLSHKAGVTASREHQLQQQHHPRTSTLQDDQERVLAALAVTTDTHNATDLKPVQPTAEGEKKQKKVEATKRFNDPLDGDELESGVRRHQERESHKERHAEQERDKREEQERPNPAKQPLNSEVTAAGPVWSKAATPRLFPKAKYVKVKKPGPPMPPPSVAKVSGGVDAAPSPVTAFPTRKAPVRADYSKPYYDKLKQPGMVPGKSLAPAPIGIPVRPVRKQPSNQTEEQSFGTLEVKEARRESASSAECRSATTPKHFLFRGTPFNTFKDVANLKEIVENLSCENDKLERKLELQKEKWEGETTVMLQRIKEEYRLRMRTSLAVGSGMGRLYRCIESQQRRLTQTAVEVFKDLINYTPPKFRHVATCSVSNEEHKNMAIKRFVSLLNDRLHDYMNHWRKEAVSSIIKEVNRLEQSRGDDGFSAAVFASLQADTRIGMSHITRISDKAELRMLASYFNRWRFGVQACEHMNVQGDLEYDFSEPESEFMFPSSRQCSLVEVEPEIECYAPDSSDEVLARLNALIRRERRFLGGDGSQREHRCTAVSINRKI